jgi:hypothetical protein
MFQDSMAGSCSIVITENAEPAVGGVGTPGSQVTRFNGTSLDQVSGQLYLT